MQGFLRPYAFGYALVQYFGSLRGSCHIVEAVDRDCHFSSVVLQWSNIHDDNNPRAIGPLNMHFRIVRARHLASQNVAHRTLLVWHETAVWAVQLERATEPFVGVPAFRFAAPQFRCAVVVIPDHTRDIARIDGDGGQIEQGAVAFLAFRSHVLDDFRGTVRSRKRVAGRHGKPPLQIPNIEKKRIRLSFAVYTGSPASSLQGSLYGSLGTGRDVHLIVGRKPTNLRVSFGARAAQLQGSGLRLRSHAGPCALAWLIVSAHQLFFDPKRYPS